MQVSKNEITGNTQITVDSSELELVKKALWDEQCYYWSLIKGDRKKYTVINDDYWVKLEEKLDRLIFMGKQLGVNSVKG